jgi:cell division protein FtsL
MFTKLLAILLVMLLTAVAMLVMRHQWIHLANENGALKRSIVQKETELWRLRSFIAQQTQFDHVRGQLTSMQEQWQPIPEQPTDASLTDLPHPLNLTDPAENAADVPARP